ncbi:MAG TPA: hypothetical protein VK509_14745 [Polyangiales bacterium]|nr:hypothetical protein [Polyangiales bacterium]
MTIESITFVRPIAPANGIDGTVPFVTRNDADLWSDADFVRVAWKGAPGSYVLVPMHNVRMIICAVDEALPASAPKQSAAPVRGNQGARSK